MHRKSRKRHRTSMTPKTEQPKSRLGERTHNITRFRDPPDDCKSYVQRIGRPKTTCCYLIRSVLTGETYVGITKDFDRRRKQHSGELPGGAVFTTSTGEQWVPICIVTGFPVEFMAAQFESRMHREMATLRNRKAGGVNEKEEKQKVTPKELVKLLFKVLECERWSKKAIDARNVPLVVHWFTLEHCSSKIEKIRAGMPGHVSFRMA